jgi:hypothetical protein
VILKLPPQTKALMISTHNSRGISCACLLGINKDVLLWQKTWQMSRKSL